MRTERRKECAEEAARSTLPASNLLWKSIVALGAAVGIYGLLGKDPSGSVAMAWSAGSLLVATVDVTRRQVVGRKIILAIIACGCAGLIGAVSNSIIRPIGQTNPPAFALPEVLFATAYLLLIMILEGLRRAQTSERDPEGIVDGLIVSGAMNVVLWTVFLSPSLHARTSPMGSDIVTIVFGLLSGVIVAQLLRLVIGPASRAPAWYLLATGMVSFVAADITAGTQPHLGQLFFPLTYTFFTASMTHPSFTMLFERESRPKTVVGMPRFTLLTTALLVAPVTLIVLSTTNRLTDLKSVATAAAALSVLVLVRLSLMLRRGEENIQVEKSLRKASDWLMLAPEQGALENAAVRAVELILGDISAKVELTESPMGDEENLNYFRIKIPGSEGRNAGIEVRAKHPIPARTRQSLSTVANNITLALESHQLASALQRTKYERHFQTLVQNSSDLTVVINERRHLTFTSSASARVLGLENADLLGRSFDGLCARDDLMHFIRVFRQSRHRPFSSCELRLKHSNGEFRWFELTIRDMTKNIDVDGYVINCHDITDRRHAQEQVIQNEARFRALVQNVGDVVAVIDSNAIFTYVSPAVTAMLGFEPDELIGERAESVIATEQDTESVAHVIELLNDPSAVGRASFEIELATKTGERRTADITLTDLREDPAVGGVVLNARDMTIRRDLEFTLQHQAQHDGLTGLLNRRRLGQLINEVPVSDRTQASVLMIDLDDFKTINDSRGHAFGDDVLVGIADRIRAHLPESVAVARLGGDEFAVLLVENLNGLGPVGVGLQLLNELRAPLDHHPDITITGSIGIAPLEATDLEKDVPLSEIVMRNADLAMYLAKDRGKDRVEQFERAMHISANDRLELKADLAKGITHDQLVLYYQPVVSLSTGEITGAEALVRWNHPQRGRLMPDSFIQIAEATGLIVQLGQWVLEEACHQLRDWQLRLPKDRSISMNVNVSVRQLEQASIVRSVREVIDAYAIDPRTLTLEVTETVMIDNIHEESGRLQELRDLGVRIALDDFGIGSSSLKWADDLPADSLKVDRSFVSSISGTVTGPVLETIVHLGRNMGAHTVAEGIETPNQVLALRNLGCDLGQGYWFSPPVTATRFAEMLDETMAGKRFDVSGSQVPSAASKYINNQ